MDDKAILLVAMGALVDACAFIEQDADADILLLVASFIRSMGMPE